MPNDWDITSELGKTGLKQWSGVVYEEELAALRTYSKRHKTYRQMAENDAVIGAVLYAIEMFIRRAPWPVQAADDTPEAEENKAFLEECKADMADSWDETIAEIVNGLLVHGFTVDELVYKYRKGKSDDPDIPGSLHNDGKLGWHKFAIRDQESLSSWEFSESGEVRAMIQSPPPDYGIRKIPMEKALLFRTTIRKGNPEGVSLLRKAHREWYFKDKIETFEAIGIERDLAGMYVFYVPPEWADTDAPAGLAAAYDEIKKMAVNIRRDEQEGIVLPYITDENGNQILKIERISGDGKRSIDTNAVIARDDNRIAMTMLAQFLLLGSGQTGSFALSSSHSELFANAVGVLLKIIADTINKYAVPRLFELNGRTDLLPRFVPGDIETMDLAELGEYIKAMSGAGIDLSSDHDLENYLREAASMPLKPEEEEDESHLDVKASVAAQEEELVEAVKAMRDDIRKSLE